MNLEAKVKKLSPKPGDIVVLTGVELPVDAEGRVVPEALTKAKLNLPEGVHLWIFRSPVADVRVVTPDWVVEGEA